VVIQVAGDGDLGGLPYGGRFFKKNLCSIHAVPPATQIGRLFPTRKRDAAQKFYNILANHKCLPTFAAQVFNRLLTPPPRTKSLDRI